MMQGTRTAIKIGITAGIITAVLAAADLASIYTRIDRMKNQLGVNISNEELERRALTNMEHSDLAANSDSCMGEIILESGKVAGIVKSSFDSNGCVIDTGNCKYYPVLG